MPTLAQLNELNGYQQFLGRKPVLRFKGSEAQFVETLLLARNACAVKGMPEAKAAITGASLNLVKRVHPLAVTHLPPAVAEGAFKSPQDAENKTGHTAQGKTTRTKKMEAAKKKIVDKSVVDIQPKLKAVSTGKKDTFKVPGIKEAIDLAQRKGISPKKFRKIAEKVADELSYKEKVMKTPTQKLAHKVVKKQIAAVKERNKQYADTNIVTLGDVARSIKLDPKRARAIARANKREFGKLEIKGKKYQYEKKNQKKIADLLSK